MSFFQDAASELVYPVLPLFLTSVLWASPAVLGLIEGVAEGTASVTKAVSGRLSDRLRSRPLIGLGYGVSSASKLLLGLATGWPLVLVARVSDRLGKGVRTSPRDALIAADTPPQFRGRAFGFHRAADTAGAVVGPLLGLALYEALDHRLRPLLFVAFIPAVISVSLVGLIREGSPRDTNPKAARRPRAPMPRVYWRTLAFLAAFGLANFSDALLILRASELGMGFVGVLVVYALYNLSYAVLSYPAGRLSDRIPRHLVFAVGLCLFAVAYIGLGLTTSTSWVWVLLPIYGGYSAVTDGVSKAWISDLLPPTAIGSGLGMYQAIVGGASLLAGVWAGLSWGQAGRLPLVLSGIIVALLAILLLVEGSHLEPPRRGPPHEAASPPSL